MSFRKNVFVLGAGFSAEAGAPLMDSFFRTARELKDNPHSKLDSYDKEVFQRVIQYRYSLNRALAKVFEDLDNIEKLFGFLEMELQLSSEADARLRKDMPYLIVRTLEVSTAELLPMTDCSLTARLKAGARCAHVYRGNQYGFFIGFASGLWNPEKQKGQQSVDSVITFNYDLVLEREMLALGLSPIYAGPLMDYSRAFTEAKLGLNLLKMHGSANWLVCTRCKDIIYVRIPQEAEIFRITQEACPKCHEVSLMPLIVPPTWNKGIEEKFLRPGWSKALEELMTAGRLFIVGYSFPETDQFFKYMLGLALAENNELSEIYVLNPSEHVAKKFEHFFNAYFYQRVVRYHASYTHGFLTRLQELTHQEFEDVNLGNLFARR